MFISYHVHQLIVSGCHISSIEINYNYPDKTLLKTLQQALHSANHTNDTMRDHSTKNSSNLTTILQLVVRCQLACKMTIFNPDFWLASWLYLLPLSWTVKTQISNISCQIKAHSTKRHPQHTMDKPIQFTYTNNLKGYH